jgi:hypothetical protein
MTPQHLIALEQANRVRVQRAQLRRHLHPGHCGPGSSSESRIRLADFLDQHGIPDWLATLKVGDLAGLLTGRYKFVLAGRLIVAAAGCSRDRHMGDLTARQVARLVEALREHPSEDFIAWLRTNPFEPVATYRLEPECERTVRDARIRRVVVEGGQSQAETARMFGCSERTVSRALKGAAA